MKKNGFIFFFKVVITGLIIFTVVIILFVSFLANTFNDGAKKAKAAKDEWSENNISPKDSILDNVRDYLILSKSKTDTLLNSNGKE